MPNWHLATVDSGPAPAMASNPGQVASPPAQPQFPYGIKELGQGNYSSSSLSALRVLELWPAAEAGAHLAWGCLDNLT